MTCSGSGALNIAVPATMTLLPKAKVISVLRKITVHRSWKKTDPHPHKCLWSWAQRHRRPQYPCWGSESAARTLWGHSGPEISVPHDLDGVIIAMSFHDAEGRMSAANEPG